MELTQSPKDRLKEMALAMPGVVIEGRWQDWSITFLAVPCGVCDTSCEYCTDGYVLRISIKKSGQLAALQGITAGVLG